MSESEKIRPSGMDYAIASLAPAFIITMIGSLVYFLLTVFYQDDGDYLGRLMWILGLYTFASVFIARIAIELGRAQAYTYMILLAGATLLVAPRFFVVSGPLSLFSFPILIGFLALIAFLADRITVDCTSMNEARSNSGTGLLQSLGLYRVDVAANRPSPNSAPTIGSARSHNPGVWVLYFALLALPLFGLGQLTIQSASDRRWAFFCLVVYLLSSMSLLVLISLLSLRKYLRDRGVGMENEFVIRWIIMGLVAVCVVVGGFALLPIPTQSMSFLKLPFQITSRDDLQAHPWGWGNEGAPATDPQPGNAPAAKPNGGQDGQADGKQGQGQQDRKPQQQHQPQPNEQQRGAKPQDNPGQANDQNSNEAKPGDRGQKGNNADQKAGETKSNADRSQRQSAKQSDNPQEQNRSGNNQQNQPQSNGEQQSDARSGEKDQSTNKPNNDPNNNDPNKDDRAENNQPENNQPPKNRDGENQRDAQKQNDAPERPQADAEQQQPNEKPDKPAEQKPPNNKQQPDQPPKQAEQPKQEKSSTSWSMQFDFGLLLQWIMLGLLLLVAAFFAIKHRAALIKSIYDFIDWIMMLLGRRRKSSESGDAMKSTDTEDNAVTIPPFQSFADPFGSAASRWSREQIVQHIYRAAISWGFEHRIVRQSEETPDEFMRRMARRYSDQSSGLVTLGLLYGRIAYSRSRVHASEIEPLRELWEWMARHRAAQRDSTRSGRGNESLG